MRLFERSRRVTARIRLRAPTVLATCVLATGTPAPLTGGSPDASSRSSVARPLIGPTAQSPAAPRSTAAAAVRRTPVCAATSAADPRVRPLEPTSPRVGARGRIEVRYARSPFGAAVTATGHSVRRVRVVVDRLRRRPGRHYVVWAATPTLERVRRIGELGDRAETTGRVTWNQFMIVVSEERSPDSGRWAGPILLTGVSPSAGMHTMRGHGIFEAHSGPC